MKFVQEFKEFAMKGNVVDMAVGIIIGAAFNKIVNSLVNDVVMPPLGYVLGGVDFKHLRWVIRDEVKAGETIASPEVALRYGAFINTVVEFVIVALTVFVMVKVMTRLIRRREAQPLQAG